MPAVYIHIPFCLSRCYYCDFLSAVHEEKLAERYTAALCMEAERRAIWLGKQGDCDLIAPTAYFGGGTPSTLTVDQLSRILRAVQQNFRMEKDSEVTLEANPRTHIFYEPGELDRLRDAGFNRLSIGAQTFDNHLLQVIGRDHAAADVVHAVQMARSAGFDNLSLDLIFGLPGQTLEGWGNTIDRALDLFPEHISLYSLTIEEDTRFGAMRRAGQIEPVGSDVEADMYGLAIDKMTAAGLIHYEISNFATSGHQSQHNSIYWRMQDYIGLGVGAHSLIGGTRFDCGRNTAVYVSAIEGGELVTEAAEELSPEDLLSEAMWLGLRQIEGICMSDLALRFGRDPRVIYAREIESLQSRGLVSLQGDRLLLTRQGLFLGNEVFCQFV